jgi:hypothetical protein
MPRKATKPSVDYVPIEDDQGNLNDLFDYLLSKLLDELLK